MEPDTDDLNCAFPVPTPVSVYRFYMADLCCGVIVMSQMFIVLSRIPTIAVQCKRISTALITTLSLICKLFKDPFLIFQRPLIPLSFLVGDLFCCFF